jgi:hypothetical protein
MVRQAQHEDGFAKSLILSLSKGEDRFAGDERKDPAGHFA